MKKLLLGIALFANLAPIFAANPQWWEDEGTEIIDENADENNKSVLLMGQLKHVAVQARKHLEDHLPPTPSDSHINELIESFDTDSDLNHTPVLLGQLKYVGQLFYDRLIEAGYDTNANLKSRGYPANWGYDTPWYPTDPQNSDPSNWSPAVIGQLKMVFSFDLSNYSPSETNGLPNWWQLLHFGNTNNSATTVTDDGQTLLEEFQNGTDPHKLDHPSVDLKVNVIVQ